LLILVAGSLAFWVLIALPARALLNDPEDASRVITYSGTAVLLCLFPALLTLWWSSQALRRDPQQQIVAVLGGTGLRMFSVLLAAWVVTSWFPYYSEVSFGIWLLIAYLFTLALEMSLLLASRQPASAESQQLSAPVNK
jgi:hypothetical protein